MKKIGDVAALGKREEGGKWQREGGRERER